MSELPAEIDEKEKFQQFYCYGCKKLHVSAHKHQVPASARPAVAHFFRSMPHVLELLDAGKKVQLCCQYFKDGHGSRIRNWGDDLASELPRKDAAPKESSRRPPAARAMVLPSQPQADPTPAISQSNFHQQFHRSSLTTRRRWAATGQLAKNASNVVGSARRHDCRAKTRYQTTKTRFAAFEPKRRRIAHSSCRAYGGKRRSQTARGNATARTICNLFLCSLTLPSSLHTRPSAK